MATLATQYKKVLPKEFLNSSKIHKNPEQFKITGIYA
jgi:hypothetical protein